MIQRTNADSALNLLLLMGNDRFRGHLPDPFTVFKQLVIDTMAKTVVDALEVVQIDHHQRQRSATT